MSISQTLVINVESPLRVSDVIDSIKEDLEKTPLREPYCVMTVFPAGGITRQYLSEMQR